MKPPDGVVRAVRRAGDLIEAATPGQRWTAALALALAAAVLAWGAPIRRVTVVRPPEPAAPVTSPVPSPDAVPTVQPPEARSGAAVVATPSLSPLGR